MKEIKIVLSGEKEEQIAQHIMKSVYEAINEHGYCDMEIKVSEGTASFNSELQNDPIDPESANVLKGTAKLHVEPALAEHPEYWFLLCTNRFLKPFIYQLRKKIKFTSLTRDTDENVFMLDEYLYGADGRSNAGYGFWQMAYGSTGEVGAQAQG